MTSKRPKKKVVKPRVPRTRAGNTLTEAGYWGYIRGVLRNGFRKYKYKIHKSVRRKVEGKRHKWETQCASCKEWFKDADIELDHIVPCGSLRSEEDAGKFITRMYCEPGMVQDLCKTCHLAKTNSDRKEKDNDSET